MSGKPESPASGQQSVAAAESVSQRRKLVRMAMSGAPLMLSLPTTVSAQTLTSAYRAAVNDMQMNPPRVTTGADGWLRIQALQLNPPGNSQLPALYKIGNSYYLQSSGQLYTGNVNEQPYTSVTVYLLMLFDVTPGTSISSGIPYPLTQAGNGLHRSAWLSVNPTGAQNYNGIPWVS